MLDLFCTIVTSVVSIASVVVPLTKTNKDDVILAKVIKFLDNFSVFNTKEDTEILKIVKGNSELLNIIKELKK